MPGNRSDPRANPPAIFSVGIAEFLQKIRFLTLDYAVVHHNGEDSGSDEKPIAVGE